MRWKSGAAWGMDTQLPRNWRRMCAAWTPPGWWPTDSAPCGRGWTMPASWSRWRQSGREMPRTRIPGRWTAPGRIGRRASATVWTWWAITIWTAITNTRGSAIRSASSWARRASPTSSTRCGSWWSAFPMSSAILLGRLWTISARRASARANFLSRGIRSLRKDPGR